MGVFSFFKKRKYKPGVKLIRISCSSCKQMVKGKIYTVRAIYSPSVMVKNFGEKCGITKEDGYWVGVKELNSNCFRLDQFLIIPVDKNGKPIS